MAKTRQTGLGRGLGELFQRTEEGAEAPTPGGARYEDIPVASVRPNPRQPRQTFDEDELAELSQSIDEVGVLQPIVVRPVEGGYELVMGERRLRACEMADKESIPAIIRGAEDDEMLRDALLENLHRANLNPLEEAAAYQQLLEDFSCTQDELSRRIKRSRPQISNTIRLLRLPASVQRKVAAGVLSAGHARAILSVADPQDQEAMARRIVEEGLSVRSVEEIVALGVPKRRRPATPRAPSPRAEELSERLSDHFDTRVRVSIGRSRGRIAIEFASEEDLDRILGILASGTKHP